MFRAGAGLSNCCGQVYGGEVRSGRCLSAPHGSGSADGLEVSSQEGSVGRGTCPCSGERGVG